MTTSIQKFTFGAAQGAADLRVVEIEGKPWFVAADAAAILGFTTTASAAWYARHLAADERNTITLAEGKRGNPNKTLISESGLYKLIMRSDKPEARQFQDWVTRDVLPAIRKDGAYVMGEEKVGQPGQTLEDLDSIRDQIERLLARKAELLEAKLAVAEAKVAFLEPEYRLVTVDEYRASTHQYRPRGWGSRLGRLATKMARERGITLTKQPRMFQGHPTTLGVYPRELLAEAEAAMDAADAALEMAVAA